MKNSKKNIKQKTGDTKGDITISNSHLTAGRDLKIHIGDEISVSEAKEEGFELDINPTEKLIVRFGRWLLSKLGFKKFLGLLILLVAGPSGYIGYGVVKSQQHPTYFSENIYLLFIATILIAFSLLMLSVGEISRCKHCSNPYATVPLRKVVTAQMKYKNKELYNIEELRTCEICGKINSVKYTETYKEPD